MLKQQPRGSFTITISPERQPQPSQPNKLHVTLEEVKKRLEHVTADSVTMSDVEFVEGLLGDEGFTEEVAIYCVRRCLDLTHTTEWKVRVALGKCVEKCVAASTPKTWNIAYTEAIKLVFENINNQRTRREYYKPEFVFFISYFVLYLFVSFCCYF